MSCPQLSSQKLYPLDFLGGCGVFELWYSCKARASRGLITHISKSATSTVSFWFCQFASVSILPTLPFLWAFCSCRQCKHLLCPTLTCQDSIGAFKASSVPVTATRPLLSGENDPEGHGSHLVYGTPEQLLAGGGNRAPLMATL